MESLALPALLFNGFQPLRSGGQKFRAVRPDEPANNIEISVRLPAARNVANVVLASPEAAEDIRLPFEVGKGSVKFVVPRVGIYGIAVMMME